MQYTLKSNPEIQIDAVQVYRDDNYPKWFQELVDNGQVSFNKTLYETPIIEVMMNRVPIIINEGDWVTKSGKRIGIYSNENFVERYIEESLHQSFEEPKTIVLEIQDDIETAPEEVKIDVVKKPRTRRAKPPVETTNED